MFGAYYRLGGGCKKLKLTHDFVFRVVAFNLVSKNDTNDSVRAERSRNSSAICHPKNMTGTTERETDLSAHHYGAASLSFHNLLNSLLGSSKRGNLTECGVLAAIYVDRVHPSILGSILLADMLTLYLAKAQRYYQANKGVGRPGFFHQRVKPLNPSSMLIPRMKCYGAAIISSLHMGTDPVVSLPVFNFSDGWVFVTEEHGKKKHGWISSTPGSVLKMAVDVQNNVPHVRQTIGLSYLKSYEHMGIAVLSCLEGCVCSDLILDGHENIHQQSVPTMMEFEPKWPSAQLASNVTLMRLCVFQVSVLNRTSSGEHKFKVINLVVKTWINVSDYFQFS